MFRVGWQSVPNRVGKISWQDRRPWRRSGKSAFSPTIEGLENRHLLATLMVTSPADDGAMVGTLRYSIAHSVAGDKIVFAKSLADKTILLTSELHIGHSLDITWTGKGALTISGKGLSVPPAPLGLPSRIFDINSIFDATPGAAPPVVALTGLTITKGVADEGGGILNTGGTLTVKNCIFSFNAALGSPYTPGLGGGIDNDHGTLTINHSTFTGNLAAGGTGTSSSNPMFPGGGGSDGFGGGVYSVDGVVTVEKTSHFQGNEAIGGRGGSGEIGSTGESPPGGPGGIGSDGGNGGQGEGGGIYALRGTLVVMHGIFCANKAAGGNGGDGGSGGPGGLGTGSGRGGDGGPGAFGGDGGIGAGAGIFSQDTTSTTVTETKFNTCNILVHPPPIPLPIPPVLGNDAKGGDGGQGGNPGERAGSVTGPAGIAGSAGTSGRGGKGEGGGLARAGGMTLTLKTCEFDTNTAKGGRGGPSASSGGSGVIDGADGGDGGFGLGGGLFTDGGTSFHASKTKFSNNNVQGGDGGTAVGANSLNGRTGKGGVGGKGGKAQGGGIYDNRTATSELTTDTFSGNFALGGEGGTLAGSGGGIGVNGGAGGTSEGGGLYGFNSKTTITGGTFEGNFALGGNGGSGGNVSNRGDGGMGAEANGGGLDVQLNHLTVKGVTFTKNTALGGNGGAGSAGGSAQDGKDGLGGGLYIGVVTFELEHSTVTSNEARGGFGGDPVAMKGKGIGGGLYIVASDACQKTSTIRTNKADEDPDVSGSLPICP